MKVIKTEKQTKEVDVTVENYEVCGSLQTPSDVEAGKNNG